MDDEPNIMPMPYDNIFHSFCRASTMVLLINGVPIDEAPRDMHQFFLQYPHFKESAANLCSLKPQVEKQCSVE